MATTVRGSRTCLLLSSVCLLSEPLGAAVRFQLSVLSGPTNPCRQDIHISIRNAGAAANGWYRFLVSASAGVAIFVDLSEVSGTKCEKDCFFSGTAVAILLISESPPED